jgi:hypothetical protein
MALSTLVLSLRIFWARCGSLHRSGSSVSLLSSSSRARLTGRSKMPPEAAHVFTQGNDLLEDLFEHDAPPKWPLRIRARPLNRK